MCYLRLQRLRDGIRKRLEFFREDWRQYGAIGGAISSHHEMTELINQLSDIEDEIDVALDAMSTEELAAIREREVLEHWREHPPHPDGRGVYIHVMERDE